MFKPQFQDVKVARNLSMIEKIRKIRKEGNYVFNLAFGQSPFPVPEIAQESLAKYAGENLYEPVQGIEKLREKIIELHQHDHLR